MLFIGAPASSDDTPPVTDLTGEAVGAALGLTPEHSGDAPCDDWFAEYEDGLGYCLAGVEGDREEKIVLAHQINGYARTDTVEAYAAALVEMMTADVADGSAEQLALARRVSDLKSQIAAQGHAE